MTGQPRHIEWVRAEASRTPAACKRGFDITVALISVIILAPVFLAIALVIAVSNPGPILYRQTRVGKGGRHFRCYKFRSMIVNSEKALEAYLHSNPSARKEWNEKQKLAADPRVTRLGRFLRRTSLDELPQLFNVLAGQMSLVGPRPIVRSEMSRYGENLKYYLAVRPGVTGLWQVSGRSSASYDERVALDARYVREWRFRSDIQILLATIPVVISQRGSC